MGTELSVRYEVGGEMVSMTADTVKKYLVRGDAGITDQEALFFMNLCKAQKMNPFVGNEIYLVKYGAKPAQIIVGKSAYMRRAFEHPDYLGKEDGITVQRGNEYVRKEGCCLYPGEKLIGGWCRVYYTKGGKERTAFKEVSFGEYNKGQSTWKQMPATMICKVAISQCVRDAFPKDFNGLYSEEEMVASGAIPSEAETEEKTGVIDIPVVEHKVEETVTVEVVEPEVERSPLIDKTQRQMFLGAISDTFGAENKNLCNEVYKGVLTAFGIASTNDMTVDMLTQAVEVIIPELKQKHDQAA